MTSVPLQERVLRLERALAAAVLQERYNDAASLRDALIAARHADPLLHIRAQLQSAVEREDFTTAAKLRDELAAVMERFSKGGGRRVDRIIVLKGRGDPDNALRVATVSREGDVQLGLVPGEQGKKGVPRVYLQPTWSPSGDFVAMTEISFDLDPARLGRGVAIADSSSRVVIMNAFDGSVVKSAPLLKPPFFYYWSPNGRCVTLLSNDPTTSVTTVALSVLQVIAAPGAGGLDLETVTGPLASGHPFLYDFCPRDSSRVVAHMGDKNTVAVVPVSKGSRKYKVLTENAGHFGAPQWHPLVGKDGREVVLFVENDSRGFQIGPETKEEIKEAISKIFVSAEVEVEDNEDEDDSEDNEQEKENDFSIENLLSTGSTLLESFFRKGAESLGWIPKDGDKKSDDSKIEASGSKNNDEKAEKSGFQERFKRLLPKKAVPQKIEEEGWDESMRELKQLPVNKLVMCDADDPKKRRVIATCGGILAFKLSPDGETMATLVTNPLTGQDEFLVCNGDYSPDMVALEDINDELDNDESHDGFEEVDDLVAPKLSSEETDIVLSNPKTRVLAFFWSPDSRKLLFLTSLRESKVGTAQWATFDRDTNKVVRYEKFIISGIYMHCLNFFDQFGASMTPWSPDSDAFCYPGRPLTSAELELEQSQVVTSSPSFSALFMQREGMAEGRRFNAWVQKVPSTREGKVQPEDPVAIVDNVEYACWSPC